MLTLSHLSLKVTARVSSSAVGFLDFGSRPSDSESASESDSEESGTYPLCSPKHSGYSSLKSYLWAACVLVCVLHVLVV